jgi:ligand-binding sensor domain-containing protein
MRFDGYHFRVFGPEHGLPSRHIVSIVEARDGGFWLLTDRGLCRLPPGSKVGEPCRLLETENKPPRFDNGLLFESEMGNTWVSSFTALFRVSADGRRLERTTFRMPPNTYIASITDGWDGSLFVGTDRGLYEWYRGQTESRNLTQSLGGIGVLCFYRWDAHAYWLGTNLGFYRTRQKAGAVVLQREPLATPTSEAINSANCMLRRSDGTVWISGKGLTRIDVGPNGELVTRDRYTAEDDRHRQHRGRFAREHLGCDGRIRNLSHRRIGIHVVFRGGRFGRCPHRPVDGRFARSFVRGHILGTWP